MLRIQKKQAGFVWIESIGRLHVEHGKGRKCAIMSGREWSINYVPWDIIARSGSLMKVDFWAQASVGGLLLNVTSGVQDVLELGPDDLLGESLLEMIDDDAERTAAEDLLEKAGSGPIEAGDLSFESMKLSLLGTRRVEMTVFRVPPVCASPSPPSSILVHVSDEHYEPESVWGITKCSDENVFAGQAQFFP